MKTDFHGHAQTERTWFRSMAAGPSIDRKACALLVIIGGCLTVALAAAAITPEVGKQKLRTLVKLPTVSFQSQWTFDAEKGFDLGSSVAEAYAQIGDLGRDLNEDISDAETFEKIAELYGSINQDRSRRMNWMRAAELYRRRVELQPDNGVVLAGLGRSLQGIGRMDEAESTLRRAVALAPKEWKVQVSLGRFLDAQVRRDVLDRPVMPPELQGDSSAAALDLKLSAADVTIAQKRLVEAGQCFGKAIDLAPEESEPLYRRGMHRCFAQVVMNQIRAAAGDEPANGDPLDGCFTKESLNDLQHASRLSPSNYRMMGGAILFEIYTVASKKGQVEWEKVSWDSLPDRTQKSIREGIARLENLSHSGDPRVGAGALEVLGILQGPILHEPNRSIVNLKRSLALQPTREQAWESLAGILAQNGRYEELLALCEDRVRQKDTSRSHLLLAKAYEKLKQWDNCEAEARVAASMSTNDFTANLSVAALVLKRSKEDKQLLNEADVWLARSEGLLNKLPRTQRSRQQVLDLTITRGIYFALSDELDTAKQWLKAVVERDKENAFAKDVLSAMDF